LAHSPAVAKPADIISKWLNDHAYDHNAKALRVTLDTPFSPDAIYGEAEYADPLTRLALLGGGIDKHTDEFRAFRMTSAGRLCVDADITIQSVDLAVEIDVLDGDRVGVYGYENGNSTLPVPLNLTADGYVRVLNVLNSNTKNIYGEGVLPSGLDQVIVSHTIPIGQSLNVIKVSASGETDAIFKVKVNNTPIEGKRNAWTDRNVHFNFAQGLHLVSGDTIDITAKHADIISFDFNASIYGEEL